MHRIICLIVLSALACTSVLAQQPVGSPANAPATGAPGTTTPQPYAPVAPQHMPIAPADSLPLLRQSPRLEPLQKQADEDLQLLREQRERNARPLEKPVE